MKKMNSVIGQSIQENKIDLSTKYQIKMKKGESYSHYKWLYSLIMIMGLGLTSVQAQLAVFGKSMCGVTMNEYSVVIDSISQGTSPYTITIDGVPQMWSPGDDPLIFGPFTHSGTGTGGQVVMVVDSRLAPGPKMQSGFIAETLCGVTPSGGQESGMFCTPTTSPTAPIGMILAQSEPGTFTASNNNIQKYILVDSVTNLVVATNFTGWFQNLQNKTYHVYAINFLKTDSIFVSNYCKVGSDIRDIELFRTGAGDIQAAGVCMSVCKTTLAYTCYSVGSTVFADLNDDGIQQNSEDGIPGVTMTLLNADGSVYDSDPLTAGVQPLIATTDAFGNYFFGGLPAGSYSIEASFPTIGNFERASSVTNADFAMDSRNTGTGAPLGASTSGVFTLGPSMPVNEPGTGGNQDVGNDGAGRMTVDFGFYREDIDCNMDVFCPPSFKLVSCVTQVPPVATNDSLFSLYEGGSISNECDTVVMTVAEVRGAGAGCVGDTLFITRTYTIVDTAATPNDTVICVIRYAVVDSIKPIIMNFPSDTTLFCGSTTLTADSTAWLARHGGTISIDGCSVVTLTTRRVNVDTLCLGSYRVNYMVRASDACGNFVEIPYRLNIIDNVAPTIAGIETDSVNCGSENVEVWLAAAMATDGCGGTTRITPILSGLTTQCVAGVGKFTTYNYTIRASDACGNSRDSVVSYVVRDTVAPTITAPTPITIRCNGLVSVQTAAWLNSAVATAGCSRTRVITNNFTGLPANTCGTAYTVMFTVTDECGRTSTATSTITIINDGAPTWTVRPQNLTISCSSTSDSTVAAWVRTNGGGSAMDSCGVVRYSNSFGALTPGLCGKTGTALVTFTATDICGATTTATATITVTDTIKPTIMGFPLDTTLYCGSATITADSTAWKARFAGSSAIDNCSAVTMSISNVRVETICAGSTVHYYAVRATDACGNFVEMPVKLTVRDTVPPTIAGIATDSVDCPEMALEAWLAGAVATDACAPASAKITPILNSIVERCVSGAVYKTYTYTIRAEDACLNRKDSIVRYVVRDTVTLRITAPEPISLRCNTFILSTQVNVWLNSFVVAAECKSYKVTNDFTGLIGKCGDQITVTFTVVDECGTTATATSTITVINDGAPVWNIKPRDLIVECDGTTDPQLLVSAWVGTNGGGSAVDSCGLVRYTNDYTGLMASCGATGSVKVIFTAIDECGAQTLDSAMIRIRDTIAPIIITPAKDTIVECDGAGNTAALATWLAGNGGAQATDLCGAVSWLAPVLMNTLPECGGSATYTYMFRPQDACGNNGPNTIARFVIRDTRPPVINAPVLNDTVQCSGNSQEALLTAWINSVETSGAVDVCSGTDLIWTYDLIRTDDRCGITAHYTYRFTVADSCGNDTSVVATFTIIDTLPPVITGGANSSGECVVSNAGNDDRLISWLGSNAGATAVDGCSGVTWTNNYNVLNFVQGCNQSRSIDVTFYARDICGNVDSITRTFSTGDLTPPTFTNCGRPPIIVDAPQGWCSAFVNFSLPLAVDNCGTPFVTQIDTTGLTTGSLFPVGLTILKFEARDSCGNADTCEIKIVVNDFHTPPTIVCPKDTMVTNMLGECGALVNNIAPVSTTDNCPDNLSVSYVIRDSTGAVVSTGMGNASGQFFPVGMNKVTYTVSDQPSLLITEVIQNGTTSGLEISNFGAASMKLACMEVRRLCPGVDTSVVIIPEGVVVAAGGVYTVTFPNIAVGKLATYRISFIGRIYDEVTINAGLNGENIIRIEEVDTDTNVDWRVADDCMVGSFGVFNPELVALPSNGKLTSLQSRAPSMDTCSFIVTVRDVEAPMCAMHDTIRAGATGTIMANACNEVSVTIPAGVVDQVYISRLAATVDSVGSITAYLESPSGTVIELFSGLCGDFAGINVALKDHVANSVSTASCSPLGGGGGMFRPFEAFKKFYGESAGGTWKLRIASDNNINPGTITAFDLVVVNKRAYAQLDTTMKNDTTLCSAVFMWKHPVFMDNCCDGTMSVKYIFSNMVTNVNSTSAPVTLLNLTKTIDLDGTKATRTFDVGTTVVEYTLTDKYGNESVCSFNVIVEDREKPFFVTACKDTTVQLGPRACTWAHTNIPKVDDNCGVDTITFTLAGAPLDITAIPIGVNVITMIVTDIYGNTNSCTFTVTVNEYIPVNSDLSCIGNLNLSLDASCKATVTAGMLLLGNEVRCLDNYCINVYDDKGNLHSTMFGPEDRDKIFKVEVVDCNGTGNRCWSNVTIEKKLPPVIECPRDTVLSCNIDVNARFTSGVNAGKLRTGEVVLTNCQAEYNISYLDEVISSTECGSPRAVIIRRWTVKNDKGEFAQCDQRISFKPVNLQNITWPSDLTGVNRLSCGDIAVNPKLTEPSNTGYPLVDNVPVFGDNYCDFFIGYEDKVLKDASCASGYSILRTWIIENKCAPLVRGVNPIEHTQRIHVTDKTAPVISLLPNVTLSVNAWGCSADYTLPTNIVSDDCGVPTIRYNLAYGYVENGKLVGLQKGTTEVRVRATDQCGNASSRTFSITVRDLIAPVATAKEFITVSLTRGGSVAGGFAKVTPAMVNNGSYDNCGPVYMEIRRPDGAPVCQNLGQLWDHDSNSATPMIPWNNNITFNGTRNGQDSINPIHKDDRIFDTDRGQIVEFCCEDIDKDNEVILRVWDDASGDGIFGNEGDNFNETWTKVKVEDKTLPTISCPAPVTTSCDRADIVYSIGAWRDAVDSIVPANMRPTIAGVCSNYTLEFRDAGSLSTCNTGTIVRTYRVKGGATLNGVSCTMNIVVGNVNTTPKLEWPIKLHEWTKCTLTEADVLTNTVRSGQADYQMGSTSLACTQTTSNAIAATNTSTNGVTPNAGLASSLVGKARWNPNWKEVGCNVFGRKVNIEEFKIGEGCRKWLVNIDYINWCDNSTYCVQTVYKYDDQVPPVITVCPSYTVDINPATCNVSQAVRPIATDAGNCIVEGYNWRITMTRPNGTTSVVTATGLAPTPAAFTGLTPGEYKVLYVITDPCGNVAECNGTITVVGKAPTPYCISVSSAVMKDGSVELWARDFDKGSFPNCIGGELYYTFNNEHPVLTKLTVEHYFRGKGIEVTGTAAQIAAEYNAGRAQRWLPGTRTSGMKFGCKVGTGSTYPVANIQLTVWDSALNSDFCRVTLTLIDNQGACGAGSLITIGGKVETAEKLPTPNLEVTLNANLPEYPIVHKTDSDGKYAFANLPIGVNYEVAPKFDKDHANGVNTLDLVYIQRHILGIKKLDDPYKVIAADADGDQAIRVSDIVEVRKLILGINERFTTSPSWRFVDANQTMSNVNSPWPFNQVIGHASLQESKQNTNFIAVKIGDVDASAAATGLVSENTKPRSNGVTLYIEDQDVNAGQIIEIPVKASRFSEVYGYQFTANTAGMTVIGVEGRSLVLDASNTNLNIPGSIAMSWSVDRAKSINDDATVFILKAKVDRDGRLSSMINIAPNGLQAEAYIGQAMEVKDIKLEVRGAKGLPFAVAQNQPNPWKTETMIGYDLPSASSVKVTVLDISGRMIMNKTVQGKAGANQLEITRSDLSGATGVLMYKIEANGQTAQRKMIVIE